jgi:hypothetical protein
VEGGKIERAAFRFVRHNERNETVLRALRDEQAMVDKINRSSAPFNTRLEIDGEEAVLRPLP